MQKASSNNFRLPQSLDIEEVQHSSDDEKLSAINGGTVETWKRLTFAQIAEKSRARPYITGLIMSIWAIWTIAGLIRCLTAGDTSLLISSPLWLIPVRVVLKFYYR